MTTTKNKGRDDLGRYIRDRKSERKGKAFPQIREKNHYTWTGGTRMTARTMALKYGFNLNKCSICGSKDRTVVHHVDENYRNNELKNLRILCYRCHNQLHGCGNETRFKKGHKVSRKTRMRIGKANTKHGRYAGVKR
jgi:5-methylcytosine-specific restriction endonuclease McrA